MVLVLVISFAFLGGMLWFVIPFGVRRISEKTLRNRCRARKAIVLSYDDGPGEKLTAQLLALLEEQQVKATFFMLGKSVESNPDMVHRVIREGHEVGSHTQFHSNAWKVFPWRASRDMRAGISIIRGVGAEGMLFRPPYGKLTLMTLLDGLRFHQRFGWWTIDPKDTRDGEGRRQPDAVLEEISVAGGGVVLLHDFDKEGNQFQDKNHADYVMSITKQIIDFAKINGYSILPLGDVLRGDRK